MSGICGIYSPGDPALADREILSRMLKAISHRGQSGRRAFVDDHVGVAIGHVAAPAFQGADVAGLSSWHDDEEYVAILDGALFNTADVLSSSWPRRYRDHSIGVMVEHLRQRSADFPEKLDGHFSLAVWDKKQRHLWLARDTFGVKPLYYAHFPEKELLIFASELKGVLAHPAINRRLNREALIAYLTFGYVPAPLSIFDGIDKVFPGAVMKTNGGGTMTLRQYASVRRA
jgi:asparagine synthase (glutamine-hydrolysing)